MRLVDITGKTYGRLVVTRKHDAPSKNGGSIWVCNCSCGSSGLLINASNLKNGSTKSCGCLSRERSSEMGSNKEYIRKRAASISTHGHASGKKTREYMTWLDMKARCYRESHQDYPNWGGRGIRVCDRWIDSFRSFLEDMGPKPKGFCIDRKDVDGNYEPSNCKWVSWSKSSGQHRRDNISFEYQGIWFESLAEACRHTGIGITTAHYRMSKGSTPQQAIQNKKYSRWGDRVPEGDQ